MIVYFIRQYSIMLLLTMGVSMEYVCGTLDLSFAAQISAGSLIAAFLLRKGIAPLVCFALVVISNGLVGILKSVLTMKVKIPSLLATLGIQVIISNVFTGMIGDSNIVFGNGLGIFQVSSYQAGIGLSIIAFVALILAYVFACHTVYGRYSRILGENCYLAEESGMNCLGISLVVHIFASCYFSAATMLLISYTGSGGSALGADYLYKVITAMFLGAVFFRGEKSVVYGSAIGSAWIVLFFGWLTSAGALQYGEMFALGIIMLTSIIIQDLRHSR